MKEEFIWNDAVYLADKDVFGDEDERCYQVRCSDGWAVGYPAEDTEDELPEIEFTYPKLDFVRNHKDLAEYVLRYCGLYDQKAKDINYGDVMLALGEIVKENGISEWCAHCEEEVSLWSCFEPQTCPNCGNKILPCSMCYSENCNNCPLNHENKTM